MDPKFYSTCFMLEKLLPFYNCLKAGTGGPARSGTGLTWRPGNQCLRCRSVLERQGHCSETAITDGEKHLLDNDKCTDCDAYSPTAEDVAAGH